MELEYSCPRCGGEMYFHTDPDAPQGADCIECGFYWYWEPDYRADDQMIQDWQAARYMTKPD